MKFYNRIIIAIYLITFASSLFLKNPTSLDPKDVKSPGTFDNQAPETKSIITPQYAKPKIEADVTVTSPGIIQRHEQIGVLPTVKREAHYDPLTDKLEEVDVLKPEKIFAKTTNSAMVQHNEKVVIGVENGKVIPPKDDATEEKKTFGIDREENNQQRKN